MVSATVVHCKSECVLASSTTGSLLQLMYDGIAISKHSCSNPVTIYAAMIDTNPYLKHHLHKHIPETCFQFFLFILNCDLCFTLQFMWSVIFAFCFTAITPATQTRPQVTHTGVLREREGVKLFGFPFSLLSPCDLIRKRSIQILRRIKRFILRSALTPTTLPKSITHHKQAI